MPYVIHFQSCRLQPRADDGPHLTGSLTPASLGLTNAERLAVQSLLNLYHARRLIRDDCVQVALRDGAAEVQFVGLSGRQPCVRGSVTADDLSIHLLDFMFALARAATLMFWPQDVPYPVVITEKLRGDLSRSYPRVRSAYTPVMLWKMLRPEPPTEDSPPAEAGQSPAPPTE